MGDRTRSGIPHSRTRAEIETDNARYNKLTKEQIQEALDHHDKSGSSKEKPK